MKKCRSATGLIKSIQNNKCAILPVWDIIDNGHVPGVCLNLGNGAYSYLGRANWELVRNYIVDAKDKNIYLKDVEKYEKFYK